MQRVEEGQEASEETLRAIEAIYGLPNDYPEAPLDPVRRLEWFGLRNSGVAAGVSAPASGIFGHGKLPKDDG